MPLPTNERRPLSLALSHGGEREKNRTDPDPRVDAQSGRKWRRPWATILNRLRGSRNQAYISSTLLPLGRSKQAVTVSFTRIQFPGLRSGSVRTSFRGTDGPATVLCLGVPVGESNRRV